ncbi:fibroblast growth factor receptor substrate 2 [Sergentomyia squamirostris]
MGCISSKRDINDIHPNIFRVINVNGEGDELWAGDIEVNWSSLTLYRKGKEPTQWPLRCLRRYGYDGDTFCFEAGRRCLTGEGIYSFKCRRAEHLFNVLQAYIEGSTYNASDENAGNAVEGQMVTNRHSTGSSIQRPNSGVLPSNYVAEVPPGQAISPNGTIHSSTMQSRSSDALSESNYLEPTPSRQQAPRFNAGMRLSSVGSGPMSPDPISPGSPNSITNILEVTTLNPLPSSNSQHSGGGVSNLYQEFPLREHNNNKKLSLDIPPHENAPAEPAADASSPVRVTPDLMSQKSVCSPATSVDLADSAHMYMNIAPGEMKITKSASNPTQIEGSSSDNSMTPTSASLFRFTRMNSYGADPDRCYENFNPNDMKPLIAGRLAKNSTDSGGRSSVPGTPTAEGSGGINYIVLDLDSSGTIENPGSGTETPQGGSTPVSNLLPPESPKKAALGYATIDFNKTAALSNSTTPSSELESESGTRKTRHSSTIVTTRQSNSVSD